jgi:N-acetylglucosaminyldiphosphoundecaprenol N-acetyl-beta-D-mannosaminyltransferase
MTKTLFKQEKKLALGNTRSFTEEYILGVRVNFGLVMSDVVSLVRERLATDVPGIVCTTNPEFILSAQEDESFRQIVNNSFLSVPDGAGVVLARNYKRRINSSGKKGGTNYLRGLALGLYCSIKDIVNNDINREVIRGVDLVYALAEMSHKEGYTIFLLGGWPKDFYGRSDNVDYDLAEKTANVLKQKYPKINIVGASSQFKYKAEEDEKTQSYIHECMKKQGIKSLDMIFVAYNHVNQEKWLVRNIDKIPVKVGIGVGGTFDYISGNVSRPPTWVRKYSLEWLFRLCMQPWRIKRIIMAFLVFPIKIYLSTSKL